MDGWKTFAFPFGSRPIFRCYVRFREKLTNHLQKKRRKKTHHIHPTKHLRPIKKIMDLWTKNHRLPVSLWPTEKPGTPHFVAPRWARPAQPEGACAPHPEAMALRLARRPHRLAGRRLGKNWGFSDAKIWAVGAFSSQVMDDIYSL